MSARLLVLAMVALPAVPAMASTTAISAVAPAAAAVTVARYSFDAGAPGNRVADLSGRGSALTVRTADRGVLRIVGTSARYAAFPGRCSTTAATCPRALLEGTDDADLDPGTRNFRWGASVAISKAQVAGSSNVMQKGVSTTESQWKMQIGATNGRAQCVVVGRGNARAYLVRSTVSVADGRWHRVLCQRYGTALIVWVDGVQRGRAVIPATLTISNDKPLRVGGPNFNTRKDMYHGALDDVFAVLG